jgi:AcrR family transcriptional regulator
MVGIMQGEPVPVRERARRAMRAELALLAQDLFAEKGYDETTLEDLVAAAGISKRTFFRYFASKDDLVLDKHDAWTGKLVEAFSARPAGEPVWESLRRAFDVVVDSFGDQTELSRTLAMEKVIRSHPALAAGELERISRAQDQLAELVGHRLGTSAAGDPRPAALAGAALSCVLAAKQVWLAGDQVRSFPELLDEAMASLTPAQGA